MSGPGTGAADSESAPLFPIFMLSILVLFNVPYTLYRLCGEESQTQKVPWNKEKKGAKKTLQNFFSPGNVIMVTIWVIIFALFAYIQAVAKEITPFDPFAILGVDSSADDKAIKKAYRMLSLKYHPDKNPDPASQTYFAEKIAPAYKALTDETARKNYVEYGHPDGPQGMNVGIALPQWMFDNGQMAPVVLAVLMACGVLLPLAIAVCYLMQSHKYTGDNVMQETIMNFVYSPHKIKESQSVTRMLETLVVAMEYISMPVRLTDQPPMEEMFKLMRKYMKEPDKFYKESMKTRPSVTKARLLFMAQLEREGENVPEKLQGDLKTVLELAPKLLGEMMKISIMPRRPHGYGWLAPSLGVCQISSCLVQAVPVRAIKGDGSSSAKGSIEGMGGLLQLPHVDSEAAKRLTKRKVKTVFDLMALGDDERKEAFKAVGLTAHEGDEVMETLSTVPVLSAEADCCTDGEEAIMEEDVVSCNVRIVLRRQAHAAAVKANKGKAFQIGDAQVEAVAPHFPVPKVENWWLILADAKANAVLCAQKVVLNEAEQAGIDTTADPSLLSIKPKEPKEPKKKQPAPADSGSEVGETDGSKGSEGGAAGGGEEEESDTEDDEPDLPPAQVVSLKFAAPRAGKHDLTLYIMSDAWLGVNAEVPVKLKVDVRPRADREGRSGARLVRSAEDSEGSEAGDSDGGEVADDYDSEESGTSESGSEAGDDDDKDSDAEN